MANKEICIKGYNAAIDEMNDSMNITRAIQAYENNRKWSSEAPAHMGVQERKDAELSKLFEDILDDLSHLDEVKVSIKPTMSGCGGSGAKIKFPKHSGKITATVGKGGGKPATEPYENIVHVPATDYPVLPKLNKRPDTGRVAYDEVNDGGWVSWDGGECPDFMKGTKVEVGYRDGRLFTYNAHSLVWAHDGKHDDIVKYKIITPDGSKVWTQADLNAAIKARELPENCTLSDVYSSEETNSPKIEPLKKYGADETGTGDFNKELMGRKINEIIQFINTKGA